MKNSDAYLELTLLAETFIRLLYLKRRRGLSGQQIQADNEVIDRKNHLDSIACSIGLSKKELKGLITETRRRLKKEQAYRLRLARKGHGKPIKLQSNVTKSSSVYELPKNIKRWSR